MKKTLVSTDDISRAWTVVIAGGSEEEAGQGGLAQRLGEWRSSGWETDSHLTGPRAWCSHTEHSTHDGQFVISGFEGTELVRA